MQYDAGVALLTRALPFETRSAAANKPQDSPENAKTADSAFSALLASAMVRAPEMPLIQEAPRRSPDAAVINPQTEYASVNTDVREPENTPVVPETRDAKLPEREARAEGAKGEEGTQTAQEAEAARESREAEGAKQVKDHSLARNLLEALDKVRKGIRREVKAERETRGETKRAKLAEDIRGLLDLLSPLMPKKDFEALAKSAAETLAAPEKNPSKNQGQQGAVSGKGMPSLIKLAQLLPKAGEVMRLAAEKLPAEARETRTQESRQGAKQSLHIAKPRNAETDAVARVAEIRDQRINDPHSLRETVRVSHRNGHAQRAQNVNRESSQQPQNADASANAVKPAAQQTGFVPPASASGAPKDGQQSFQFMQHTPQETSAVKKARAAENDPGLKNAPAIMKEIAERARVTVKSGKTDMHMTLHPRSLGRITMHFSLGADGELSARLTASNDSVRQYLQDNLSSFSRDLADAGVQVAQLEVLASGAHTQSSFGRSLESGQDTEETAMPAGIMAGGGGKRASQAEHMGIWRHDGLLDVRA